MTDSDSPPTTSADSSHPLTTKVPSVAAESTSLSSTISIIDSPRPLTVALSVRIILPPTTSANSSHAPATEVPSVAAESTSLFSTVSTDSPHPLIVVLSVRVEPSILPPTTSTNTSQPLATEAPSVAAESDEHHLPETGAVPSHVSTVNPELPTWRPSRIRAHRSRTQTNIRNIIGMHFLPLSPPRHATPAR
ncbi:hypothetical protein BOTBODRAFT_178998 [Botryobasidium botryosum FD-172 SS1]|uniref:Uncharacterized protein n=1 Tax=Botryobasidium botryosum (strain FD-172 SS1) TaxID=930990 RepID=A0A067M419_BOTB1|nr:hypothetical protein BOTBODRAFT_178998 [Botryobasidium botryosum FD-172 SS1]